MSDCANSNKTLEETEGADKYRQIQRHMQYRAQVTERWQTKRNENKID